MKVIAGWVVGLLLVVGIGVGIEAGVGGENYLPSATIDQIALKAAMSAGDRAPTSVTWVRINNWMSPGGCNLESCSPPKSLGTVYMLEVNGAFFDAFTQVQVIVSPSDPANPEIAASHGFGPLTGYGAPETDSLVGLRPVDGSE